ncbi:MAG TPA: cytochrome c3 family protein [Anaeromyxobacteraceae bacterium]|nr:cytochrome c3 family protein [Anaeromyxobacteraceae bacterium]
MRARRFHVAWLARALLLGLAALPAGAPGGDWHRDRTLVCSDCHTIHNSKGGRPMRYDDAEATTPLLLRAADATSVCLACHRGDRPSVRAPGVMAPSNWDPAGGGFPADLSDPAHHAHALGSAAVVPPGGDTAVVMSCVTCHDPHGNDAYRNLRASPSGTGRASAAPAVSQTARAGQGKPDPYLRASVRYQGGFSAWCLDCHGALGAGHVAGTDPLFQSHPWDRALFGAAAADYAGWAAVTGARVPVQNAAGLPPPSEGDQVFCLSCHKAHGSPNDAALIHADGATRSSTCQECHNQ